MDFDFTDEQVLLRTTVRELLARECGSAALRGLIESDAGYSESTYRQLGMLGLLGVTISEQYGGQGLGMVEQAIVLEEMGRVAYPGPYFASTVLTPSVIQTGGVPEQLRSFLPEIANGTSKATLAVSEVSPAWDPRTISLAARRFGISYRLTGEKRFVPWAHVADVILVAARTAETSDPAEGITVFAVPRRAWGVNVRVNAATDLTNRIATVTLDEVTLGEEAIVGRLDEGWKLLATALQRAALGASAEMLGAARKSMELSVEYAKVREQFGQPIGMFQAVKHACAEMLLEVENAQAAVYYAAWTQDGEASDAALAASVAKAYVSEAARKVCGSAIQVHGGIGFTWEYDLHLYFKRAKHLESLYGDADSHQELALRELLREVAVPVSG